MRFHNAFSLTKFKQRKIMSRSNRELLLRATPTPDYFDLTKNDVSEIKLIENKNKDNCEIISRKEDWVRYKGFKLTDNPKVNVCCDVFFFRSSETDNYVPRLTFIKVDKDYRIKEQEVK
ncbi:MAG TPA: hypothetical protein PKY59_27170, partial [Pyrinomonadaceae bacterium]|nr:hypothetical protein [Pyrinomonadaceae bacterium]